MIERVIESYMMEAGLPRPPGTPPLHFITIHHSAAS